MSGTNRAPHVDMLRSPLGRARGLGSARAGSAHWWGQRVTAVALVPLTLWFIWSVLHLTGASQGEVAVWMSSPVRLALIAEARRPVLSLADVPHLVVRAVRRLVRGTEWTPGQDKIHAS